MRYLAGRIKNVQGRTAVVEPVRVSLGDDGSELDRIDCDADDTVWAGFETETGVIGNLFASWAGHGASTVLGKGRVFYGSKGRVTGDTVTLDDGTETSLAELYEDNCDPERKEKDFPLGLESEFARTQIDWLDAVRQRRAPEASGREGLMDLACAFAVLESHLEGKRVKVDEVMNGSLEAYQAPINARFEIPRPVIGRQI